VCFAGVAVWLKSTSGVMQIWGAAQGLEEFTLLSVGGAGILLVLRAATAPLAGRFAAKSLRMFPEVAFRNVLPLRQRTRPRPSADLPNFGLVFGTVILAPFIIFAMFALWPRMKTGLLLRLQNKEVVSQRISPWGETLAVYVNRQGRFSVNGELVRREDLGNKLSQELAVRPSGWFGACTTRQIRKRSSAIPCMRWIRFKVWAPE
jgi:hypothetical protein